MQFRIDQVALYPRRPDEAIELLKAMGLTDWIHDHVSARGSVHSLVGVQNEADLEFNYQGLETARELEVLHYTRGASWMNMQPDRGFLFPRASHIGMHCSEEELDEWKEFFRKRKIPIAQEVRTFAHTNPVIAGKRLYHYVIFDTYHVLGIDVKFIVRHDQSDL